MAHGQYNGYMPGPVPTPFTSKVVENRAEVGFLTRELLGSSDSHTVAGQRRLCTGLPLEIPPCFRLLMPSR